MCETKINELLKQIEDIDIRHCCKCNNAMWSGWYNEDTFQYYCSEKCLRLDFTEEEQEEAEEDCTLWATMWEDEESELLSLQTRLKKLEMGDDYPIVSIEFEEAIQLFNQGEKVYVIYDDETEGIVNTMDYLLSMLGKGKGFAKDKQSEENAMFKISFDDAVKMFENGSEVFALYDDGTEGLLEDMDYLLEHHKCNGEFGIEK